MKQLTVTVDKETRYTAEGRVEDRRWRAVKTPADTGGSLYAMDRDGPGLPEDHLAAVTATLAKRRPDLL